MMEEKQKRVRGYVGRRFGKLLVEACIEESVGDNNSRGLWFCRCDCGGTIEAKGTSLKGKNMNSCGCFRSEARKSADYKGRKYKTLTFNT